MSEIYYDEEWNEIPMPLEERKEFCKQQENAWKVFDAFGNELQSWDSIIAIKNLPVKWWTEIKLWEKFTKIKLTDDLSLVLVKHEKNWEMYLKTEFFKKG